MMPPISVTAVMLRRWARFSGVSRVSRTRRRRSFSTTSAARLIRLSDSPMAMAASVRIEQGATTIPSVAKEPDAMLAPMSLTGWTWSASASTSARLRSSSVTTVCQPADETSRCVSMSGCRRRYSSRRTPRMAPLAPVMAMMRRRGMTERGDGGKGECAAPGSGMQIGIAGTAHAGTFPGCDTLSGPRIGRGGTRVESARNPGNDAHGAMCPMSPMVRNQRAACFRPVPGHMA